MFCSVDFDCGWKGKPKGTSVERRRLIVEFVFAKMSAYDSVVVGKLKLKGKALDVKAGGIKKKKKKYDESYYLFSETISGGNTLSTGHHEDSINEVDNYGSRGNGASYDDHLTPAERRYLQQTEKLELQRLAKLASRSHRDRIQAFNQYLANLSEHYDIPKVGPG